MFQTVRVVVDLWRALRKKYPFATVDFYVNQIHKDTLIPKQQILDILYMYYNM